MVWAWMGLVSHLFRRNRLKGWGTGVYSRSEKNQERLASRIVQRTKKKPKANALGFLTSFVSDP
jgi:hypothetical protein